MFLKTVAAQEELHDLCEASKPHTHAEKAWSGSGPLWPEARRLQGAQVERKLKIQLPVAGLLLLFYFLLIIVVIYFFDVEGLSKDQSCRGSS